jgi:hypothetical protein
MYLWLELERPHLLEFGQLRSFLTQMAGAASDRKDDFDKRSLEIDRALSSVLWEFMLGESAYLSLEFSQSGPAVWMLSDEFKPKGSQYYEDDQM